MTWISVGKNVGSRTGVGKYKIKLEYLRVSETRKYFKNLLGSSRGTRKHPYWAELDPNEPQKKNVDYCKYEVSPHLCYQWGAGGVEGRV